MGDGSARFSSLKRLGAITLPLACTLEVYLSDIGAIPHENKARSVRHPLCDTASKRYRHHDPQEDNTQKLLLCSDYFLGKLLKYNDRYITDSREK